MRIGNWLFGPGADSTSISLTYPLTAGGNFAIYPAGASGTSFEFHKGLFGYNDTESFIILADGPGLVFGNPLFTLNSAGLKVLNTQVVGPQGAQIPNAVASVETSMRDTVNNILDTLRTHGLIAQSS